MWVVYPEVLRAYAQKSPFFSYIALVVWEKSLKNNFFGDDFENSPQKIVFKTFLQNG